MMRSIYYPIIVLLWFLTNFSIVLSAVCESGVKQSPIDLDDTKSIVAQLPHLSWSGHTVEREGVILSNALHTVEVIYPDKNSSITGGPLNDEYVLSQIHFHWGDAENGSEHAINTLRYDLEAHLVHYKKEYGSQLNASSHFDGIAVVGILFQASLLNNSNMNELIAGLREVRIANTMTILPPTAMVWLENHVDTHNYYTYEGSLTTSPYSENVYWIVMSRIGFIGELQLEEFKKIQNEDGEEILQNIRSLQAVNGRRIFYSSL